MAESEISKIPLFAEVSEKLKKIETFREPPLEFNPGKHTVVAEMSEDLKKLFTFWFNIRDAAREWSEKAELTKKSKEKSEALRESKKALAMAQALEEIFWFTLVEKYNLWGKSNIAVTQGFRVVSRKR